MRILLLPIAAASVLGLLAGCGTNPQKTQRPDLLDDKVTTGRVLAAMERAGYGQHGISVHATNQFVTLTGLVGSGAEKRKAEQIVRTVHRVRGIDNQIKVNGTP
jgi:osmotically-inducible protein OsmY